LARSIYLLHASRERKLGAAKCGSPRAPDTPLRGITIAFMHVLSAHDARFSRGTCRAEIAVAALSNPSLKVFIKKR
jgi:hypothetical protein